MPSRHTDWSIVLDRNRQREEQRTDAGQMPGGASHALMNVDVIDDSEGAKGGESVSFTLANLVVVWRFCGFVLANMVAVYALEYMITSGFLQACCNTLLRTKDALNPLAVHPQPRPMPRAVGHVVRAHIFVDRQLGQQQPE